MNKYQEQSLRKCDIGKILTNAPKYFKECVHFISEKESVSKIELQRLFKLGYAQVTEIIDLMIECGFVRKEDSNSIYFKTLITPKQYNQLFKGD